MIDVYYWPTPNGHKITIFLEEAKVAYKIIPIDITKGDQFAKEFLVLSPNNKMPAIVDHKPSEGTTPISIFESGAILLYLAEKTHQFLPQGLRKRYETLEWLFWQVAGLGPMLGQNHHFVSYAEEKIPYAIDRYLKETARLYAVLNKRLLNHEYIADEYSIADMACYPWIVSYEKQQQNLDDFPAVKRWFTTISEREAVKKAYQLREQFDTVPANDPNARKVLFGQDANTVNRE